jgi:hypothetical protein
LPVRSCSGVLRAMTPFVVSLLVVSMPQVFTIPPLTS